MEKSLQNKNGILGIEYGLSINYFIMFLIDCLVGIYLPMILKSRGFSSAEIGELRAFGYSIVVIGPFLYAIIAKRTGNRKLALQIGSWLSGITVIALFLKLNFMWFAILIIVQSFFQQGTATQLDALSLNTLLNKDNYGKVRIWGSIGFVVTAISGGFISDHFGLNSLIWYMVVVQIILMCSVMTLPSDSMTKEEKEGKKAEKFPIKLNFVLLILVVFFVFVSQGVYNNFFMIYVKGLGYSQTSGGTLMSVGTVAEMFGLILSIKILSKFKVSHLLAACAFVTGVRWLLQGFEGSNIAIMVLSQLGHAFTFALLHTTVLKFIKENFKKEHVGIATGIYGSAGLGAGNIVGSLLSGFAWDLGPHIAFTLVAIMAFVGGGVALFIKSSKEPLDDLEGREIINA